MRSNNTYKWLFCLVLGVLLGIFVGRYTASAPQKDTKVEVVVKKDSVVTKKDTLYVKRVTKPSLNDHTLLAELKLNHIKHADIVLAQAKLETGHYKSNVCKTHNNLFGLKRGNGYRSYSHWTESVKAYKRLIQSRYSGGNYYVFLKHIGYSNDPYYTNRLKNLV